MWSTENQAPLIIELRKQALAARNLAGINEPLLSQLSLELKLFGTQKELDEIGDLDNVLSGVCDALQPKPNNPTLDPSTLFDHQGLTEISPEKAILFVNDSKLYKLIAEKRKTKRDKYYSVTVKPINDEKGDIIITEPSSSSIDDIQYWADKYDEEHPWWTVEEARISEILRKNHEFGLQTLREIVHWKFYTLPGRRKRVNNLLNNYSDMQIREISRKTFSSNTDKERIETLCTIKGVGVAISSTILSFYDPEKYCVYDIHVMREVYGEEPKYMFTGNRHYLKLLNDLRIISKKHNLPVRTIEKAYFKKNLG